MFFFNKSSERLRAKCVSCVIIENRNRSSEDGLMDSCLVDLVYFGECVQELKFLLRSENPKYYVILSLAFARSTLLFFLRMAQE